MEPDTNEIPVTESETASVETPVVEEETTAAEPTAE